MTGRASFLRGRRVFLESKQQKLSGRPAFPPSKELPIKAGLPRSGRGIRDDNKIEFHPMALACPGLARPRTRRIHDSRIRLSCIARSLQLCSLRGAEGRKVWSVMMAGAASGSPKHTASGPEPERRDTRRQEDRAQANCLQMIGRDRPLGGVLDAFLRADAVAWPISRIEDAAVRQRPLQRVERMRFDRVQSPTFRPPQRLYRTE